MDINKIKGSLAAFIAEPIIGCGGQVVLPKDYLKIIYPEIVKIISNEKIQYAASNWHSDVTWRQEPSMGSILRGKVIPEVGGDTSFANTAEAYKRLDSEIRNRVDSLYAIHDFSQAFGKKIRH